MTTLMYNIINKKTEGRGLNNKETGSKRCPVGEGLTVFYKWYIIQ
jgi:hypothetical protein